MSLDVHTIAYKYTMWNGFFCFFLYVFLVARPFFSLVAAPSDHGVSIVVLAGNYKERIPVAAELYRSKRSHTMLLTNDGVRRGWSHEHQRNLYSIERSEIALLQANIPASAIIKLPFYRSGTVHDARAVRRYLQKNPMKSILLVTSDYHANRALWIFKQVLKDLPVSIAVAPVTSGWSSAVPIMLEPLKTVYYRVRFGLLEKP